MNKAIFNKRMGLSIVVLTAGFAIFTAGAFAQPIISSDPVQLKPGTVACCDGQPPRWNGEWCDLDTDLLPMFPGWLITKLSQTDHYWEFYNHWYWVLSQLGDLNWYCTNISRITSTQWNQVRQLLEDFVDNWESNIQDGCTRGQAPNCYQPDIRFGVISSYIGALLYAYVVPCPTLCGPVYSGVVAAAVP